MATTIEIAEETGSRRVFLWAVDWPGWCRSGRDPASALEALRAAAGRYAVVARVAGLEFGPVAGADFQTVTRVQGGSATDFGVPSQVTEDDRRAVEAAEAENLAALVGASWVVFDRIAAAAPEVLRKGPRGGGRDTSQIIAHVEGADHAYAREIGIKLRPPGPDRVIAVDTLRASVLEILAQPSDGLPLAGRRWPQRYAARRIAWHALDHAWEIEDRSP